MNRLFALGTLVVMPLWPLPRLIEGAAQSPVRVVIYEDLQCSDCAVFRVMLDGKLLPKYGTQVAFEHRDFPLAKHAWARKAAIASRFFEKTKPTLAVAWRQFAMANQTSITAEAFNGQLSKFAQEHGVDGAQAISALDDPKLAALVEADFQEGIARGIAKTPTALVNGQPFIETFTVDEISKAIDSELAVSK